MIVRVSTLKSFRVRAINQIWSKKNNKSKKVVHRIYSVTLVKTCKVTHAYLYTQDWQCSNTTIKSQNSYNPCKELGISRHQAVFGQLHPAIVLKTSSNQKWNRTVWVKEVLSSWTFVGLLLLLVLQMHSSWTKFIISNTHLHLHDRWIFRLRIHVTNTDRCTSRPTTDLKKKYVWSTVSKRKIKYSLFRKITIDWSIWWRLQCDPHQVQWANGYRCRPH